MKKKLSQKQRKELLHLLKTRFEKNKNRHKDLEWDKAQERLEARNEILTPRSSLFFESYLD